MSIGMLNRPTVASWHGGISPPLIPYIHFTDILMEPFPLHITKTTKVFGEVIEMVV